jgi:cytochrome c peroxidase
MKPRTSIALSVACAAGLGGMILAHAASAQTPPASNATPCSSQIDIASYLPGGANEDPDVGAVNRFIDETFAAALAQLPTASSLDLYHQIKLLGTLGLYDKNLSVNENVACTSCHFQAAGFTGGVSLFNETIVAQPGSVPITNARPPGPNYRISARKPQSYGYAPFAPILQYNATQQDFYGGNFWDMRATGIRLDNPAAEQAQGPPVNPLEMGLSDTACAVFRVSRSKYARFFEEVFGEQSFAINWPTDVELVCSTPGPPPANDPLPVHLSPEDRGTSNSTYDNLTLSMASYEASPDVSPFSSKFDYALANPTMQVLRGDELAGWELFRGKGTCNTCHLDGTEADNSKKIGPPNPTNLAPLFTDFTSANLGLPKNQALPFYCESTPDQTGYVANPAGLKYVDKGVGGFLSGPLNPNADWAKLASQFNGKFQTPTLRNVDMRPRPDFVKAYMHNGYLKSLEEVVHFYNTRDTLGRCKGPNDPGEKVTCWPAPEVAANVDKTVGNLGLSPREEEQIVAFLKTLTDHFVPKP